MMRNDDRFEEQPPYSRVFVVCSKQLTVNDLKPAFEQYGELEDIHMPRDRNSGESKGIAYVKYTKTSSAALAIQELHQRNIPSSKKPVKVMVASHKSNQYNVSEDQYKRLFIKVHKEATENELRHYFSQYGRVESIRIQKDKVTEESRGFAYVNYKNFFDAAKAYEECDRKYKPIFATPKDVLKRNRNSLEGYDNYASGNQSSIREPYSHQREEVMPRDMGMPLKSHKPHDHNISVTCTPMVPQRYLERLFNIIPGLTQLKYSIDSYNTCKATVAYDSEMAGQQAIDRINNFEFPSGEIVHVKPEENPLSKAANDLSSIVNNFKNALDSSHPNLSQLAEAIAQASTLIKVATSGQEVSPKTDPLDNYCSVQLPPSQPIVSPNTRVAQRCFLVFKPHPLPVATLRDAFCRFGDLIDVSTFPNKTFGFAKYASVSSAQEAIRVLHGATIRGIKLKVMKADEKPREKDVGEEDTDSTDHDIDRKRMKMADDSDSK